MGKSARTTCNNIAPGEPGSMPPDTLNPDHGLEDYYIPASSCADDGAWDCRDDIYEANPGKEADYAGSYFQNPFTGVCEVTDVHEAGIDNDCDKEQANGGIDEEASRAAALGRSRAFRHPRSAAPSLVKKTALR